MEAQKIICTQCGAVIPPGVAHCPYCGSAYAPEAEREYMQKLEQVRKDLENVGNTGAEVSRKEIGSVGKRIGIVVGIILILFGLLFGAYLIVERKEEINTRKEYFWKQEHLPELNRLYEEGDYDALLDAFEKAQDEGYYLYDWEHRTFVTVYRETKYIDLILQMREKGVFSEDDAQDLLYSELVCRGAVYAYRISKEDQAAVQALAAPYADDLTEIFHASDKEIADFDKALKESSGYPSYDACREYVSAHPEIIISKEDNTSKEED